MKELLNKIISFAAAAAVLIAGFAVLPNPNPEQDGSISSGNIIIDNGENENDCNGVPSNPVIDDDWEYIQQ